MHRSEIGKIFVSHVRQFMDLDRLSYRFEVAPKMLSLRQEETGQLSLIGRRDDGLWIRAGLADGSYLPEDLNRPIDFLFAYRLHHRPSSLTQYTRKHAVWVPRDPLPC